MKQFSLYLFIATLFLSVSVSGCQKEPVRDPQQTEEQPGTEPPSLEEVVDPLEKDCSFEFEIKNFTEDLSKATTLTLVTRNSNRSITVPFDATQTETGTRIRFLIPEGEESGAYHLVGFNVSPEKRIGAGAEIVAHKKGETKVVSAVYSKEVRLFGTGSATSPYLVSNLWDLQECRNSSGNFRQTQNIDITAPENEFFLQNGGMNPIETFYGDYDGDGKSIIGLIIKPNAENPIEHIGIFGYTYGATLRNISVEGIGINSPGDADYVGGIVGCADSTVLSNCKVLSGNIVGNGEYVGGVVGNFRAVAGSSMTLCENQASVKGVIAVGGIAGKLEYYSGEDIYSLNNRGNILSDLTKNNYPRKVGGIFGYVNVCSSNNGCFFNLNNYGDVKGPEAVGGVIGKLNFDCKEEGMLSIFKLTSSGNIATNDEKIRDSYAGGIVGLISEGVNNRQHVNLQDCTNNSTNGTKVSGASRSGGIIGAIYASKLMLKNLVNHAAVSGRNFYSGGVIGSIQIYDSDNKVTRPSALMDLENYGTVTNNGEATGGIVGMIYFDHHNTNSSIYFSNKLINDARIENNQTSTTATTYVGGVVGQINIPIYHETKSESDLKMVVFDHTQISLGPNALMKGGSYLGGCFGRIYNSYVYFSNAIKTRIEPTSITQKTDPFSPKVLSSAKVEKADVTTEIEGPYKDTFD